jgi:diguanylate cyclase (GGDEF)-like protein
MEKNPETPKHYKRCKILTVLAGLAGISAIAGISTLLESRGANMFALSVIHKILTGVLIIFCVLLYIMILHYRAELDKLKTHASTDKLTDLYNRSYLDLFLENQIEEANRSKKPVSIIMVDLDHFKEINDAHGHNAGDHVLSIFAQVVLKCIRKSDIIARYGGDEFIVVLPDTNTETAHTIAERIRHDVSNACIPPVDGDPLSSISCSVGVSTYPVHCNSKHSLIKTSDLALYEAKRSGRNRTIVYNMQNYSI